MTHQPQVPPNNQMSAIDRIPDEDREGMEKPLNRLAKAIAAERAAPPPSLDAPAEIKLTDWPCNKCGSKQVIEKDIGGGIFEDYSYRCLDCGHKWQEEGSDS